MITSQIKSVPKQMKVLERFQPETITCDSKEEFQEYLNKHADTLNSLTTQKLNRMFNVKGYRVTKIKGEIGLRALNDGEKVFNEGNTEKERIDMLESNMKKLYQLYSEMADIINARLM